MNLQDNLQNERKKLKIELIKDVAAGDVNIEVAKLIIKHFEKNRLVILVHDDETNELKPESQIKKDLLDQMPEKYKKSIMVVDLDEQDISIGTANLF